MKKTLSVILCLVMILSIFTALPFGASATQSVGSETNTIGGITGDCTWQINGTVLTISGSGKTEDYDRDDHPAPWLQYDITEAVIEDGVTEIGDYSFFECPSMTSISVPSSVTKIGNHAFYSCRNLKRVNIHDIGAWCSIDFSNFGSNPLRLARSLYLDDELVTELIIPDSVTHIGSWALYRCLDLTSVTIPDSVVSIGAGAFGDCMNLTSITIPESVTEIGDGSFSTCRNLTSITIPDSVTSLGPSAFSACTGLTSVTIGSSVTKIESTVFWGCSAMTSISIPDSVTSIDWGAFRGCTSLMSITIPDSVTSIGESAFENCPAMNSVTIPDSVKAIGSNAFGYLMDEEYGTTTKVNGFTVCGVSGSAAQTYADENGFIFKDMGDNPGDPVYLRGDYDNNGKVDIMDATRAQNILAKLKENPGKDYLLGVDATGDDVFNIMDATRIQNFLARIKNMDGTDFTDAAG